MATLSVRDASTLQSACDRAQPGDVILVASGRYDALSVLHGKRSDPARPIVIRAADSGWIFGGERPDPNWGRAAPETDSPGFPKPGDFAFLRLDECVGVRIEGLKLRDFWPSILFARKTSGLHVRGCSMRGATYAIFAKERETREILIEDNDWVQDESPGHDLWTTIDWARAHGGEGADGAYRYFNGGFFASKLIGGDVVIRRNRIADAYNGVRMKGAEEPEDGSIETTNVNIHIHDNDFVRIRDNPLEAEGSAVDWHVRHNRLVDCHAWFSFDGLRGGRWFYYGNTGRFTSRQGLPGVDSHSMGRVLKLSHLKAPAVPDRRWHVFNNSWLLRCPIVGGASEPELGPDRTAHLAFFNNAFDWCDIAADGAHVCEWIDPLTRFDLAGSPGCVFDHDVTTLTPFMETLRAAGHEGGGRVAKDALFADARGGDFSLAPGSAASGAATLAPHGSAFAIRPQSDGSLSAGAMQDYGLASVPVLEAQAEAVVAGFAAVA